MFIISGELFLWSFNDDISIKDNDIGAYRWVIVDIELHHTINITGRAAITNNPFSYTTFFFSFYLFIFIVCRYHDKRIDNLHDEGKREYRQKRGMVCVPQNKKGNKLKDAIKYLEVH